MLDIYKFIGAIGIILISLGLLFKKRANQDVLYIIGGACLIAYSIHIRDTLFIILQIIFILSASYNLVTVSRKNRS